MHESQQSDDLSQEVWLDDQMPILELTVMPVDWAIVFLKSSINGKVDNTAEVIQSSQAGQQAHKVNVCCMTLLVTDDT